MDVSPGPQAPDPLIGTTPAPWAVDIDVVRRLTPTDIAQFVRLEQCQRYLRLRLVERAHGRQFLYRYGVAPESIPVLLTRSGARFEQAIEAAIAQRFVTHDFDAGRPSGRRWVDDNERVLDVIEALTPGQVIMLFQPRLAVEIAGWQLRGDVDLLRLARDDDGQLTLLITDMKSSTSAKVEHRLQVAFYHRMLATLLHQASVSWSTMQMGILYRGPAASPADAALGPIDDEQRTRAERFFGTRAGRLELIDETSATHYLGAVDDLVTGPASTAARIATAAFDDLTFHLTYKCDGCLYNQFCLKWAAERDDLSLVPHLTAPQKAGLQRVGVRTTTGLAHLKAPSTPRATELVPAPDQAGLLQRLAVTWPVGPVLDALIHRARAARKAAGDQIEALSFIPSSGYSSLPACRPDLHPNLVLVYLDAQHDYLHDRLYLLSALVVAHQAGQPRPDGRHVIVRLSDGPPDTAEREEYLLVDWISATLRAIVELAAPDGDGQPRAPIHIIVYDSFARQVLLDALARHLSHVLGATPLYDFLTQLAAFDSPIATVLEREIRERRAYPLLCQSLQAVATYLGFDWGEARTTFRTRLFDWAGRLEPPAAPSPWYTARARFSNQLPLEYAYAAWGELPPDTSDAATGYQATTAVQLVDFAERRLLALEHVAATFPGNPQTQQSAFSLPDLATFTDMARSLADALAEFVIIERHVELSEWKAARLDPPETRMLAGQTLLVRYCEADQTPEAGERNRENERRRRLREQYRAAYRAANPQARQVRLPPDQRAASDWSQAGLRLWLRLVVEGVGCTFEEALALTTLREGSRLVICPRWDVDSRLPPAQQVPYTPTAKAMLYGLRGSLVGLRVERDADGVATGALIEVELLDGGGSGGRGFTFPTIEARAVPLVPETLYSLDEDPNSWTGSWNALVTDGLVAGQPNTLYQRLVDPTTATVDWPTAAVVGQARLLAGLDALQAAGALHGFEAGKRRFIGEHGTTPTLQVQGPPGTGKSYTTAFALLARLQGALAADRDYRVVICCKTHAATDVLLENVVRVQRLLAALTTAWPAVTRGLIDERLLSVPLLRMQPPAAVPEGVIVLNGQRDGGAAPLAATQLLAERWCVLAATPGGIYRLLKDQWPKQLFGHALIDALVLDEASQMNVPEACLAALPLKADGHLIVVGDHRQMPPIVRHDWSSEPRRTFQAYRAYESLFAMLSARTPPTIRFAESFRLHATMAEFLRREVYQQDGIAYHSRRREVLTAHAIDDDFVAAVLAPAHPIVVIVHDEASSQLHNPFEQALIAPVLDRLADAGSYQLEPIHGLGVVVPHRAQRAALQMALPALSLRDESGAITRSAVDTVERFQGDERTVIVVSATESDRDFLVASSKFLLDPRRLTVALSRAKQKLILVASRSIFSLFAADEEAFAHAQLWKNLLRQTCTVRLWVGEREGQGVEVWGNAPATAPATAAEQSTQMNGDR